MQRFYMTSQIYMYVTQTHAVTKMSEIEEQNSLADDTWTSEDVLQIDERTMFSTGSRHWFAVEVTLIGINGCCWVKPSWHETIYGFGDPSYSVATWKCIWTNKPLPVSICNRKAYESLMKFLLTIIATVTNCDVRSSRYVISVHSLLHLRWVIKSSNEYCLLRQDILPMVIQPEKIDFCCFV